MKKMLDATPADSPYRVYVYPTENVTERDWYADGYRLRLEHRLYRAEACGDIPGPDVGT